MEIDYFFMFLGIVMVVVMIHLVVTRVFKKTLEGLENQQQTTSINGIGPNIDTYDAMLQTTLSSLNDTNNIPKYKDKKKNALQSLKDILNHQLLQQCLSFNVNDSITSLEKIVKLHSAINAVDDNIQFVEHS
jgi:glutaredoxin 2